MGGSVENRPYAGTWKLNNRQVVKYTPDALVFLNGDTSLPGCPRCRGRIRIQDYVTALSVEAGTSPTSHSATITLNLPRVTGQQVFIDGYNVLRPGLEVNIFMRGYFQVRGMFKHLKDPQNPDESGNPGQLGSNFDFPNPTENDRLDLAKFSTYPYYPVFHGVVTQVNYDYSDGFYTGSLQCASLLHFWQYQNIASTSAWLAQDKKPNNDPARPTLQGHNFNNMHPFGIIYTLYKDVAGAATGVEFALDEASNLDPTVQSGAAQVYDQVTLYWSQRFKTRIQNLRMYGTTGRLYNAAQQAWFKDASSRDVDGVLTSSTYNDPTTTRTEFDPTSARWSTAKALGLTSGGSDLVYSPLINKDGELFNLSVLDMFAFSQAISELGVGNVFQSTYQTKMDVAQSVMEITGYEFYQDVDGDLVFKPPFWNLDTSTNRYYRLEDQDLINISFTEKEPTATFIIVRGTWFQGVSDIVPNTDSTGKRALYIDYKLVAQFGWRPAPTLDITYATDPKVLFWIGVARLDMLNVDTFSASATIPIRPEMRPGYPVFVPFADSYYYISQLSHSFSFGGVCTTNLVLVCKRSKFHAPGELREPSGTESAIDLIKLDRPDLPPRPLRAYDERFVTGEGKVTGVPRLVGFPNVVLALDPQKINPNYTVIGLGVEFFDQTKGDADILFSLLQRDVDLLGAFEAVGFEKDSDGRQRIADPTQIKEFRLRYSSNPDEFVTFNLDTLRSAFTDFQRVRGAITEAEAEEINLVKAEEAAIGLDNAFASIQRSGIRGQQRASGVGDARGDLDTLRGTIEDLRRAQEVARGQEGALEGINLLALVFEALQPDQNKPIRRRVDGIAGSDVTMSYFETLSHLKSQYMSNTIPGHFRYYSSAHPDEEMQGQPVILFNDGRRPKRGPISRSRNRGDRRLDRADPQRPARFVPQTRAEARDLVERMQEKLSELGVTTITAAEPLPVPEQFREGNPKTSNALLGFDQNAINKNTNNALDSRIAQNLVDIAVVADGLIKTALARPDWPSSRTAFPISTFRPSEGATSEALHKEGKAIDIMVSGSRGVTPANVTSDIQQAHNILIEEAGKLRASDVHQVTGIGVYQGTRSGWFIHIDRRDRNDLQAIKEERADRARQSGASQESIDEILNRRQSPGRDFWIERGGPGGSVSVRGQEARPIRELGGSANASGTFGPQAVPENTTLFPDSPEVPEIPPAVAQTLGEPDVPAPDPEPVAELLVREVSLEAPRSVVQFSKTVTNPEDRDPPEVLLTLGSTIKGLNIAQGTERTPRVITTDQIQNISFVRYESSKFAQVVGTSSNAGSQTFQSIKLFEDLATQFAEAGQGIQTSTFTVAEGYQGIYDQIVEDVGQIAFPIYEDGVQVGEGRVELLPFEQAVTINSDQLAPDVAESIGTSGQISLSGFTFDQLTTAKGYAASGRKVNDGQAAQDTIQRVGNAYARSVQRQINEAYNDAKASAMEPVDDERQNRLSLISQQFNQISTSAVGNFNTGSSVKPFESLLKAFKQGKTDKPLHSPVFPVSDEKGYQHYGAYRYGRGLSVEPGGTFEFIHSGQDPFRNVTAQTAEDFVQAMTLTKEGKISTFSQELSGIRDAAFQIARDIIETNAVGAAASVAVGAAVENTEEPAVTPSAREVGEIEQATLDLANTVANLRQTARGRDVLRELLEANGDDPQLIKSDSFQITDTQFARNFANYAVNYAKSPVFKTTVANAAYQLSDLTSHLLPRSGDTCVCRGSYADIVMEAYSRTDFVAVDGIDQRRDKAAAYSSEVILQGEAAQTQRRKRVAGSDTAGVPLSDAKSFTNGNSGMQAISSGAPLPSTAQATSEEEPQMVSPENPPTTVNPDDLPGITGGPAAQTPAEAAAQALVEAAAAAAAAIQPVPDDGSLPDVGDDG